MALPTEKTPPKEDMADLSIFLHGPPKVGKTTFCAQAEDALFLACEPGLNSQDVFQVPICEWSELLAASKELEKGEHRFKTIVLDTVDNAYRMCADHICRKFKVEHESDLSFGKGYALVNNEFHRVLTR